MCPRLLLRLLHHAVNLAKHLQYSLKGQWVEIMESALPDRIDNGFLGKRYIRFFVVPMLVGLIFFVCSFFVPKNFYSSRISLLIYPFLYVFIANNFGRSERNASADITGKEKTEIKNRDKQA